MSDNPRPTRHDPAVLDAVALDLLPRVLAHTGVPGSDSDRAQVLADLRQALGHAAELDGYALASELERGPGWQPDAELVRILDRAVHLAFRHVERLTAEWVAAGGEEKS